MNSVELAAVRIPQRRVGQRFDIAQVDAFLDECVHALRASERRRPPGLQVTDIVVKQFRSVPLFGLGYDADAVDDLLDQVAIQLRAHEPESAEQKAQEAQLRATLDDIQKDRRDGRG